MRAVRFEVMRAFTAGVPEGERPPCPGRTGRATGVRRAIRRGCGQPSARCGTASTACSPDSARRLRKSTIDELALGATRTVEGILAPAPGDGPAAKESRIRDAIAEWIGHAVEREVRNDRRQVGRRL